jgi:hypothetical protein
MGRELPSADAALGPGYPFRPRPQRDVDAVSARATMTSTMAALDALLEQAMQLPDDDRGALAIRLLRTLEPDDGDEVVGAEWEAAWAAEIDERIRHVDGGAELLDGDQVIADATAWLDAQRR